MNRIEKLFSNKKKRILSVYFTAGYPQLNDTVDIIKELDNAGADMIEIGMPFSDPVADGSVIQMSSEKALANGMSVKLLFDQLEGIRKITDIPLILMGYINPVYKFGIDNFLSKCSETGIDGTIIPDLPPEEYKPYEASFIKHNIHNIFLVSPQTLDERVRLIDSFSKGFIYIVSSAATTGAVHRYEATQINYFRRIQLLNLSAPLLIGFGVSGRETFEQACDYASGAIIGSAFIRTLENNGTIQQKVSQFINQVRGQY